MSGYVAISREIWNDPDFPDEPMTQREAFMWLVAEAAWKPRKVRRNNMVIALDRGQLAHSVRFMAEAWGWHRARVERFLKALKNRDSIETQTETGVTVITICKYEKYQSRDEAAETSPRENRDSTETNENQDNQHTTLDSARATPPADLASRVTAAAEPGIADPAEAPGVMVMSEPMSWLRSGADLEADILPTLTALGARASPGSIRSWGYFTAAVMEAKARREREHETPEISDGKPHHAKPVGSADRYRAAAETQQSAWLRAVAEPGCSGGGDERSERPGGDQGGDGRTALRIATG